ncbi:MAG: YfjI family protein [Pseudomonadota bacterium]
MPAGAPFPVRSLGPFKSAVEAVQGQTQAPIAIPAAAALSAAALAVQGHVDVETLAGPRPVSLFLLTVAKSGERKSSCERLLVERLRAFERAQSDAHQDAMASWKNDHALWTVARDSILGDATAKTGDKRREAKVDLHAMDPEPAAPPIPDRTVTEPTFEGLTRRFAEGLPSQGLFSDEGGRFLGGFAMSKDNRQKTLTARNKLWDGSPIQRTRQGDGSFTLFGRRLSVHLMVQPGVWRDVLADPMTADTGFLAQFLICEPPSTIGRRLQRLSRADTGAIPAFNARLRAILEAPLPMDDGTHELQPRVLRLTPGARALLAEYADHLELGQAQGGAFAEITGAAAKAAELAARIAGVMTAWTDLAATEVTPETMADAITLSQYYLGEALRLADASNVSRRVDQAERLRTWLRDSWKYPEILPSEVVQSAPIRALRERPAALEAIEMLVETG